MFISLYTWNDEADYLTIYQFRGLLLCTLLDAKLTPETSPLNVYLR